MSALIAGIAGTLAVYLILDAAREVRDGRRAQLLVGPPSSPRPPIRVGAVWRRLATGELPLRTIQASAAATAILFAAGLILRSSAPILIAAVGAVLTLYAWSQRQSWTLAARVDRQLPEAMTVMANAISAGATLFRALEVAAAETPTPLGPLLQAAVARCAVNQTVDESLRQMQAECGSRDLGNVVAALLIQRTTGGNLPGLLRESAGFLREEQRLRADARSLSAQARYSSQLIGFMPAALFGLFYAFFPSHVAPLTTTTTGNLVLVYAALSTAFGYYLIWRIAARIERG